MTEHKSWKRALLEGIVIVLSILFAFGVDAWWDRRNEAEHEQRLLAALLLEFQQNDGILQEARAEYEQRYVEARQILGWIDGDLELSESDSIRTLLAGILQGTTYTLQSGAYDGLISAGDLYLIQDYALKNQLAAWPGYLSEWTEEEEWTYKVVEEELVPYFFDRLAIRGGQVGFAAFPHGVQPPPIPSRPWGPGAVDSLRNSVEFDNLVYRLAQATWYNMRDLETLRARISTILEFIRRNLDT